MFLHRKFSDFRVHCLRRTKVSEEESGECAGTRKVTTSTTLKCSWKTWIVLFPILKIAFQISSPRRHIILGKKQNLMYNERSPELLIIVSRTSNSNPENGLALLDERLQGKHALRGTPSKPHHAVAAPSSFSGHLSESHHRSSPGLHMVIIIWY